LACKLLILKIRRDVRVVEGARLESVCRGNSTVGSNPTLSVPSFSANSLGNSAIPRRTRFSHPQRLERSSRRTRPEIHKRLMVLAVINLLPAALFRNPNHVRF